jgi:hypothetical protein
VVVPDEPPAAVLAAFGLAAFGAGRREVTGLSDVPDGNANWLISGDSGHLVLDWPLSPLEESAAGPVYRAVRAGLAAWPMEQGRRTGRYDLDAIERQLDRSGTPPP